MTAMKFNVEIPALLNHQFQNHYILVIGIQLLRIGIQDAVENIHYPELSGESVWLEMFFERPLKT